jgi:hypothetical protein
MKTFTCTAAIDSDGHLRLDMPTQLPPGQVELVLVIQPSTQEIPQSKHYDFSDLVGKLSWQGDAVLEQRKVRNEW